MTHTRAEGERKKVTSVQKLERKQTDRQTDDCITASPLLTRSVKLKFHGTDTDTDFSDAPIV